MFLKPANLSLFAGCILLRAEFLVVVIVAAAAAAVDESIGFG